ncbi:hypothetical protein [Streptomyces sp. V4I2]|uniref:hypothetical protein n=1 Tax=Streptomyces sp. V4I2 TaxID=3042280 RepID=UPI0027899EF2|nr:hypothetical protein [Streptomyces sp. V4I2]MDQ1047214.1 hypothetical protein [Streptomyces sp. V4I2]
MQILNVIQISIAVLAGLCLLVAGVFSVLTSLSGAGTEGLVAGRAARAPEPYLSTRRRNADRRDRSHGGHGGHGGSAERPPLPTRRPGAAFPGPC